MSPEFWFPQGAVGEASQIHNEGMRVWREGRLDEALRYFLKALSLKEKVGNLSAAASTIHMIGVVHAQKKDWVNAARYMLRSLEIDAGDRHFVGVAKSMNDIATMCSEKGDGDARAILVGIGNILLDYTRGTANLDGQELLQLCDRLPPDLKEGVRAALNRLLA